MTSSDAKESPRIEIEIATVLLGFLFIMDSIILMMPSDILSTIQQANFSAEPIFSGSAADFLSLAGYYCTLILLAAIPFYLSYLGIKRKCILVFARSLLALGLLLIVLLVVLVNASFMFRLVGMQTTTYINSTLPYVLNGSLAVTVIYIVISWFWWLWSSPTLQSFRKKHFQD
jgi:hypothetical protein